MLAVGGKVGLHNAIGASDLLELKLVIALLPWEPHG